MNPEESLHFNFEEYNGKLVGEKKADNNLKRKNSGIKTHMAAIIAASIMALVACTYEKIEEHSEQESTVEEVTETGGIPFSEERIKEFEGNVVITNPEALKNAYKNSNDSKKDEDAKNKSNLDSISPEEVDLMRNVIQHESENSIKKQAYIFNGKHEAKDLTQTQVIVKQAIDNALRVNELIGKNGLSENELEQVIKNSEAERAKLKEKKKEIVEVAVDDNDPEYWKIEDTTYAGIDPPKDTATSIWIPTGEQTPYQELGDGIYKSDPAWRQVSLEFDKVIHHMTYGNACSINPKDESVNLIPIYITVEFAIQKRHPLQEQKLYQECLDAKIGKANALIAGICVPIEKVDGVSSFDSISFALEKTNSEGKTEIVGYVNGNDLVESLARNMADMFQDEETNTK